MGDGEHLTEAQKKWFASLREGLERDSGRTLDEWVAVARTCPETRMRARLRWFKENHGLAQNRASLVLAPAFGSQHGWDDPDALIAALWDGRPNGKAIMEAVSALVGRLDGVVLGARKGYTAWSRAYQFAAVRPAAGDRVRLGLAVSPDASGRLTAPASEGWSERLRATLVLTAAGEADETVAALLRQAWERS